VSFVFRRASRDLQDGLLRSVERLAPSDDGAPSVAALRNVDADPERALAATVALVYRALYDLLVAVADEADAATEGLPDPSATEPPSRAAVRSVFERVMDADPPEIDGVEDVFDRFLDSLLAARESVEVATAEARELVELGAHMVTYLRLYARLYEEYDLGD